VSTPDGVCWSAVPLSSVNPKALEEQALRLHHRYEIEIVEACGLCPWAERARLEGRVQPLVVLADDADALDASLAVMKQLEATPRIEVALLIYPRCELDRLAFQSFVARVRDADAARHPLGSIPFVMAAFHPDAAPDLSHPERLIPFLRRTPDPTIQLLRADALDRVRGGAPQGTQFFDPTTAMDLAMPQTDVIAPLRERIARANQNTVEQLGVAEMERRLRDIRRDREQTYRELARAGVSESDAPRP
jgi:hypothetical protein